MTNHASKQLPPWRNHGDRTLKQIRFHYPQSTDIGKPSAQGACRKSRYNTTPLVTLYASPTSLVAEPTRDTTSTQRIIPQRDCRRERFFHSIGWQLVLIRWELVFSASTCKSATKGVLTSTIGTGVHPILQSPRWSIPAQRKQPVCTWALSHSDLGPNMNY